MKDSNSFAKGFPLQGHALYDNNNHSQTTTVILLLFSLLYP